MIIIVVLALALLGATTWTSLQQPVTSNPVLNRRLTGAGLALCLLTAGIMVAAALVTWR